MTQQSCPGPLGPRSSTLSPQVRGLHLPPAPLVVKPGLHCPVLPTLQGPCLYRSPETSCWTAKRAVPSGHGKCLSRHAVLLPALSPLQPGPCRGPLPFSAWLASSLWVPGNTCFSGRLGDQQSFLCQTSAPTPFSNVGWGSEHMSAHRLCRRALPLCTRQGEAVRAVTPLTHCLHSSALAISGLSQALTPGSGCVYFLDTPIITWRKHRSSGRQWSPKAFIRHHFTELFYLISL